jgi:hypothetical protein
MTIPTPHPNSARITRWSRWDDHLAPLRGHACGCVRIASSVARRFVCFGCVLAACSSTRAAADGRTDNAHSKSKSRTARALQRTAHVRGTGGGGRLVSRARHTCCSAAMCDSGSVALVRSLLPLLLLRRAAASTRCSCPARCHLRRSARRYLCNRHERLCVAWQRDARHAGLGDLPLLATL